MESGASTNSHLSGEHTHKRHTIHIKKINGNRKPRSHRFSFDGWMRTNDTEKRSNEIKLKSSNNHNQKKQFDMQNNSLKRAKNKQTNKPKLQFLSLARWKNRLNTKKWYMQTRRVFIKCMISSLVDIFYKCCGCCWFHSFSFSVSFFIPLIYFGLVRIRFQSKRRAFFHQREQTKSLSSLVIRMNQNSKWTEYKYSECESVGSISAYMSAPHDDKRSNVSERVSSRDDEEK